jgi:hypothetical protein
VRDSRRKAAHITKDAYELQGKIINPAFGGVRGRLPVCRKAGKKKAWLGSHARTTTRRMEEPLPGA